MKKMRKNISVRQIALAIACVVSVIMYLLFAGVSAWMIGKQDTQTTASRWSEKKDVAQVSCFFSVNAQVTKDSLINFSHTLDGALEEASVESESENPDARLWADAFSATGTITLSSNLGTVTSDAIGIGGDFFLFHPLQLISGSFFSGNDLMQDYCVLDELAAWKLFGSNDIAGQTVEIAGVTHIVTGVVKHKDTKLYKAAGLDEMLVYVSYDSLEKYGTNHGINHYEIVMPNPVKGYAMNYVTENIGVEEREIEIVENSSRYNLLNRIKQIKNLAIRSMNGKAIIYPYWENIARVYADILVLLMLLELLFLGFPVIVICIVLIFWWKRKTWTVKGVLLKGKDKLELVWSRLRVKIRNKWKNRKKRSKNQWTDIKEFEED